MPLTEFQKAVLCLLARNRNPESYVAGGIVLNQAAGTPRFSADVDLFHDVAESVAVSAKADESVLVGHGYIVQWTVQEPAFYRAVAGKDDQALKMEWLFDSAFRFFPVEPNPETGFRLNRWDAAANKILALAGRNEARDFVDVLHLHQEGFSLGALCWAAAGKDPGMTPEMILGEANRNAKFTQEQIDSLQLVKPLSIRELKEVWIEARRRAAELIRQLPPEEVGCLYLEKDGTPVTPDPSGGNFSSLCRHFGCVKGAWPVFCEKI
ncbi:MAG: nucleotidyl transferase AbiEii/AbiGii toxin family protein [Verrucomicrobiae bacterium]|nr:nucleotidyl transferase AbiEii/AbiGii toxin family protein [Verrucomicrobiae bacterium]